TPASKGGPIVSIVPVAVGTSTAFFPSTKSVACPCLSKTTSSSRQVHRFILTANAVPELTPVSGPSAATKTVHPLKRLGCTDVLSKRGEFRYATERISSSYALG